MGVRISWLILARNWPLLCVASSAFSRASRSVRSYCLSSVMSWKMPLSRTTRPFSMVALQVVRTSMQRPVVVRVCSSRS